MIFGIADVTLFCIGRLMWLVVSYMIPSLVAARKPRRQVQADLQQRCLLLWQKRTHRRRRPCASPSWNNLCDAWTPIWTTLRHARPTWTNWSRAAMKVQCLHLLLVISCTVIINFLIFYTCLREHMRPNGPTAKKTLRLAPIKSHIEYRYDILPLRTDRLLAKLSAILPVPYATVYI